MGRKLAQLTKKRREVTSRPLTREEVSTFLNVYWNGERQFPHESYFFSEEWEGILGLRPMTKLEANKLLDVKREDGFPKYSVEDLVASFTVRRVNSAGEESIQYLPVHPMTPEIARDIYEKGTQYLPVDDILCKPMTPEQAEDIYDVEKVPKYRPATTEEANILYCDIHSKDIWE